MTVKLVKFTELGLDGSGELVLLVEFVELVLLVVELLLLLEPEVLFVLFELPT